MLGRRAPAQEQRRAARGDGRAGGRPVRGEVIGRSLVLGLLLAGAGITGPATAAERCTECVTAGAASDTLRVPPGTPLAGYGAMKRRLLFPNVFDRHAHAFWFVPATGERDPLVTRALVLEAGATRLAWVTLDLVAVDGAFVAALRERLARAGVPATALVVSASHTRSGPGAFMSSSLVGFVAVDRFDPEVRDALVASAVSAIRQADRARTPALVAATSGSAPAVTASRLGKPLDPEIVVLKLTTLSGSPLAPAMPRAVSLVAAALGDTAWVTFPGEPQTALGQTIKREARRHFASVLVAGVSNDYLGYFTTRQDARDGKYVTCATVYGHAVGHCLTEAATDVLRGLRPESGAAPRAASTCDADAAPR